MSEPRTLGPWSMTPSPQKPGAPPTFCRSVLVTDINEQRERGWPDFHPEDFCHRCGQRNVHAWHIESEVWNAVMRGPVDSEWQGIVCPQCFTELHAATTGATSIWRLERVGP